MVTIVPNKPNWRTVCGAKLVNLQKAIGLIRRGDHIYLSAGSAVPSGIVAGLVAPDAPVGDNQILHLLTLGDAPYTRPQFAGRFRHNALFIGPNVRDAVGAGRADYTPVFLSELPALIRSGRVRIDVAIISLTPPDAEGYCAFGTHVDLGPAAIEAARLVIAEINPRLPRVPSPCRVHVDRIHAMVECDHPLPELGRIKPKPETAAIARHIAELIPDGATLQLGIGEIPDGVLTFLKDRKNLGIHSEMFSDGVMELVKAGVITGGCKSLHQGKVVAGFILGSRHCYEWAHENPHIELHPSDYTNDPMIIAQQKDMVAVNACLEIDLTGQVCSDSIGPRFYSGVGGQVDFIRGAARARHGKPIIALPSLAEKGTISRIVPRLADGAGVVTTRGDVHWVVTEYGAVNLHGMCVRERALALISVAHPRFRPWLLAEAKRSHVVYADQIEAPLRAPLYPESIESHVKTRDGTPFMIRPVKPTDERLLRDFFYRLSQDSVYQRFFAIKKYLPHETVQRFCNIDYDEEMTLVAEIDSNDVQRIVGWALYKRIPNTTLAEAAFVVDDAFQGRGIGRLLIKQIAAVAAGRGLSGFEVQILANNLRMQRAFLHVGEITCIRQEGDVAVLRARFQPTPSAIETQK